MSDIHLLRQLVLPARYEALVERVGVDVARLLVAPAEGTQGAMAQASIAAKARGEGLLLPLVASSGTGKTTLASNLVAFLPAEYAPTVTHLGDVRVEALAASAEAGMPTRTDARIVPINVDHREADPPSSEELAEIKRFLREGGVGSRCVILWPHTSGEPAAAMAAKYQEIAGRAPISLPIEVEGPPRETWQEIAIQTLRLSNDMIELDQVGVDPRDYNPEDFASLGEFLRQISDDFSRLVYDLLSATRTPLKLIVGFCSESARPGVLTELTGGSRYGLVTASQLMDATPDSGIGRYWRERSGALTQTIVRLDARVVCIPPTVVVPALRQFGGEDVRKALADLGVDSRGPASVAESITRSDLGGILTGAPGSTFEARGTPSTQATPAFQALAESGFNLGRDKGYNKSMAGALSSFFATQEEASDVVVPEKGLLESSLIPDNKIEREDHIDCIEYTWRKGDFLVTGNRSAVAQYVLEKLKNYAVDLGWVEP